MRKVIGFLARKKLAPCKGRYRVRIDINGLYSFSIDWTNPRAASNLIGKWFEQIIADGYFNDGGPQYTRHVIEVYKMNDSENTCRS